MKKKVALITGVGGQAGSYLAELLLEKDYDVIGMIRRNATRDLGNAKHLENIIDIVEGDITDFSSVMRIIQQTRPQELYSLAAQSHVHTSFEQPIASFNINTIGPVNILEAVRLLGYGTRIYQASSITFDTPVMIRLNSKIMRTTLEDAFNIWNNRQDLDTMEVLTCNDNGEVVFGKVKNVIDHGEQQVQKICMTGGRELKLTDDHSLIVMREGVLKESKISNLKKDEPLLTFCCESSFPKDNKLQNCVWEYELSHTAGWHFQKLVTKNNLESLVLDNDLAYLLGMYCAEGCYSGYNVTFTYGNVDFDKDRPAQTVKILKDKFNVNSRIYRRESSTQVMCSKKLVGSFFKKFLGTNSHNKRLPSELYSSPKEVQMAFLNGYLGDAKISDLEVSYTTVHKDLAIDITWLLRMLGFAARLHIRHIKEHDSPQKTIIKSCDVWDIRLSGSESWMHHDKQRFNREPSVKCLPKNGFAKKYYKNPSRNMLKRFGDKFGKSDLGIEKIQNIEKLYIPLRVGDFCVEETERWFCGEIPILVHNTSELWGDSPAPQNEETVMRPRSPYACAKLAAHWMVKLYREAYKMYCCCGITHNFESPRRGPLFVTRKITLGVANILAGKLDKVKLGNLQAKRDWGFCPDYCEGWVKMLQQPTPDDYVFATNEVHTVQEFCEEAFGYVGLNWENYVEVDRFMKRPAEVEELCGDYSKAKDKLGWEPKIRFKELVRMMVDSDCKLLGLTEGSAENLGKK